MMNKLRPQQQKRQEKYPIDEKNMRWLAQQFAGFQPPRTSEVSLIMMSEAKEGIPGEDHLTEIPRSPSCSELSEPILAGFISSDAKGLEDTMKSSITIKTPKRFISDTELRNVNKMFNFDFERQLQGLVHESESEITKDQSHQVNLPAWTPYSQRHRKVPSSPTDLFDYERVFKEADSLRSESFNSSASSWYLENRIADLEGMCDDLREKNKDLEGICDNMRDDVRRLKQKNKELLDSKKIIAETAARNTLDFENAINELVEEVVQKESELDETRIMLSDVWEKSQVAQEAAKHRRKRNTSFQRQITKLKSQLKKLEEKKSTKADYIQSSRVNLSIASIMGQSYMSPVKKNCESIEKGKTTPRASKVLLKPESDANENCMRKLAEGGFEDTKTIRITVEEVSPAKEPSMISSLEIGESNPEISDLMTSIQSASQQQIIEAYSSLQENELTGFGEQVDVDPSFFHFNKFHEKENDRSTRSRDRQGGHRRRRSWSAPPNNKAVYISLLKAIARSKIAVNNDSYTKRFSTQIGDEAMKKLSQAKQRRERASTVENLKLSPKRSFGRVPTIGTTVNTPNVTGEGEEELFEYPDIEQLLRDQRSDNEWRDQSIDGLTLDSLERDFSNSFTKPIDLSLEPQRCISFAPADKKRAQYGHRRNKSRRKTRARSVTFHNIRERPERSPSFTLV